MPTTFSVPDEVLEIETPMFGTWHNYRGTIASSGLVVRRLSDGTVWCVEAAGDRGVRLYQTLTRTNYRGVTSRYWGDQQPLEPWTGPVIGYARTGFFVHDMPDNVDRAAPPLVLSTDDTVESLTELRDTYRAHLTTQTPEARVQRLATPWMQEVVSPAFSEVARENNMCSTYEIKVADFNDAVPAALRLLDRFETGHDREVTYTVEVSVPYRIEGSYIVTIEVTGPAGMDEGDLSEHMEDAFNDDIYSDHRAYSNARSQPVEYDEGWSIESYDED